ncbi:KTSC domain-containing protein [Actinophytocola glycyrrhizae]|uniref:KTSC domain-containing protein n=1 Tax=Actinophytocola glycyrrhizae TaxID=2044873 RepID=A0ABV9S9J1_9PSEU
MYRQPVESSAVVSVGYDKKRRMLEVEVDGGAVYQYLDVPPREYFALVSADSVGRYYNQQIKVNYEFLKV